jgi:hypothetical protein
VKHESRNFARAERNDRSKLEGVPWVEDVIKTHNLDRTNDLIFCSMGYGQILYLTAVDMGFVKWAKDRAIDPGPETILNIEVNLYWTAKFIKDRIMRRYTKPEDIAAAYNAGSARKDKAGKYLNQDYVDSVMAIYKSIGGKP